MKKYSFLAVLFCFFGIWSFAGAREMPNGARLYAENCAGCHGPSGEGGIDVPPLAGMGAESVLKKLAMYAEGKAGPYADPELAAKARALTPDERAYVAYYAGTFAQPWNK